MGDKGYKVCRRDQGVGIRGIRSTKEGIRYAGLKVYRERGGMGIRATCTVVSRVSLCVSVTY